MNFIEAKEFRANNPDTPIYMARYDGRVWQGGRMVDVGEVISYHLTIDDAKRACGDYELVDFDRDHIQTSVELCNEDEFND